MHCAQKVICTLKHYASGHTIVKKVMVLQERSTGVALGTAVHLFDVY